jgi:hypothetical protein
MPERLPPAEFLRKRNDLWQRLRPLEPHDPQFEPLLEELRVLTNSSRDKILEGLGLKRVPVTDEVFDLAVNRADNFLRGAGKNADLAAWHAQTRFVSRVNLELIQGALSTKPKDGVWHWAGGSSGAWAEGKARTP